MTAPQPPPSFDEYAGDYDSALQQGLAISGESKDFFAAGRIAWLRLRLEKLGEPPPRSALDFGCGTGSSTPFLHDAFPLDSLCGVDVSAKVIEVARKAYPDARNHFSVLPAAPVGAPADLAFCNGVFHHIPPVERPAAVRYVFDALRPGGLFAFWENNPWNPGTHIVMSRIPFDRDAILVWPAQARRLARGAGFEILSTTSQFFFPAALKPLRFLEPILAPTLLGAQYLVLCRKPVANRR